MHYPYGAIRISIVTASKAVTIIRVGSGANTIPQTGLVGLWLSELWVRAVGLNDRQGLTLYDAGRDADNLYVIDDCLLGLRVVVDRALNQAMASMLNAVALPLFDLQTEREGEEVIRGIEAFASQNLDYKLDIQLVGSEKFQQLLISKMRLLRQV